LADSATLVTATMLTRVLIGTAIVLPAVLPAQSQSPSAPREDVMIAYENFAIIFGSRLVAAFDSIPAARYDYRPTPKQQTIGYIAQHLENANYSLCERRGDVKHTRTAKDALPDTVKARWPKDTLVARLRASLYFCDTAMARVERLESVANTTNLLAFETDLAEHYSQISVYMRLLGMLPPSALPPKSRALVELPASTMEPYVGRYQFARGLMFEVTMRDGMLFIASPFRPAQRLSPASSTEFVVKEVDAEIVFTRDASGAVTGFLLRQYGRDRPARKVR
jgi:hypothetical protein